MFRSTSAPKIYPGKRLLATLALSVFALSACYTPLAARYIDRTADGSVPWWCEGVTALAPSDCLTFSIYADLGLQFAHQRWRYQDGLDAGGVAWVGDARVLLFGNASAFDPAGVNLVEYESTDTDARAIGVGWRVSSVSEPEGFIGARDTWVADTTAADTWVLRMWVLRGYENHPDVFAPAHPCQASLPLTSTSDACFVASHTEPLDLLVTSGESYDAQGIDMLVEALVDDPNDPNDPFVPGITVTVVAPLALMWDKTEKTLPAGAQAASTGLTTLSGYPVTAAVHGTAVDTAIWALDTLSLSPDLVLTGVDRQRTDGLWWGNLYSTSVALARAVARRAVSAIGASAPARPAPFPDYASGVAATLTLLERWRIGDAGLPMMEVPVISTPSCEPGSSTRGTRETGVMSPVTLDDVVGPWTCFSVNPPPGTTDTDALSEGFISISDLGKERVNYSPP